MGFSRCSAVKHITLLLSMVALLLGPSSSLVVGQTLYGSLVGTVTDSSGGVIPNADVTATDTGTGQVRHEKSDDSGRYNLINLQPGTYTVSVSVPGFRKLEQSNITITPNTVTRSDMHMEVGQQSEQVSVSAAAVELQTDKADTHTEITSEAVADLPISSSGYRNYQSLIDLTPGSTPTTFYNSKTDVPGVPLNSNVNGGNGQTNVTTIDGAESVNVWLPQYAGYVVPAETVDVVNVTTSAADASQGLAGSSAITVVTKSGTNQIHGSAFEYYNGQHLNARNFFLTPGIAKPVSIFNNYGGTIGGPVKKDKIFFFGSFDGTAQKQSGNGLYTVPTADQRAGDFSAYNTTIYNPFTGNPDGTGRQAFAGNKIPVQMMSQAALKLQSYFPAPNLGGTTNNFAAAANPILDRYQTDVKVNWNRTDKHNIFVKYDNMVAKSGGNGIFGVAGGPTPSGDPGLGHTTIQVAAIGHTYTFGPNLVLDGTVGYERLNQNVKGTDYGTNYSSILGIPGLNGADIRDSGFPNINFATYTGFGVPNWMPLFRTDETYTTSHKLTWTKGAHEVRFGFDLVRHHLNHWQPELSNGGPRGYFDFTGGVTTVNAPNAAAANQYNAYAQFLLGLSDNTQKGEQYILMTGREWQIGSFVQDRWQVAKNLTVTLGVRYELYPLMTRSNGKGIESYDPNTNNVYMGGRGDVPENAYVTVSHKMFAPRVGIAWRVNDKTVIRTGYGINFDPIPFSRPWRGFYPLTINDNYTGINSYQPANGAGTLDGGIPPVVGPDLSTGIVPLDPQATERAPVRGELKRGYIQSWNFTVERQLPGKVVASAGYVGQKSTHLLADYDLNAGVPGLGQAGQPLYRAFGDVSPIYNSSGYLSSTYHSLQVAFNRQFSQGLMLKGAYTWSHAIDFTDDEGWAQTGWFGSQFPRNRATAGFDRTHVFQLGWVYELPVGQGKPYLNSGIVSKVIGGWQFSGRESAFTGNPYTVTADGTSLNAPDQTQTANQVAKTEFLGGVGPGAYYYNPNSFAPVNTVSFGNVGRNTLRGPGQWNTDVSIQRTFPIEERYKLQFRAEFYNLPNTSHFSPPDTNVNDGRFMQVTSSYGERNIRFALHLAF